MSRFLDELPRALRYAARSLSRTPVLAMAMIVTIALGIGGSTAIFSVVKAVLWPALAYEGADRIVRIVEIVPPAEQNELVPSRMSAMSVGDMEWWRANSTTLSHFSVSSGERRLATVAAGRARLRGSRVTPEWFAMRGVAPLLGRWLQPGDDEANVVAISRDTWRRHFGDDPGVLGMSLVLDDESYTVVGVMPEALGATAYWRPYRNEAPRRGAAVEFVAVAARLRDGVSVEAASHEANTLGHRLRDLPVAPDASPRFAVERVIDQEIAAARPAMSVLIGCVAIVLVIVCANVANLLLARGLRRRREIATRRALGASSGRIARQLLTESLLLAAVGGVLGTLLALAGVRVLQTLAAAAATGRFRLAGNPVFGLGPVVPGVENVTPDAAMLIFAGGVALASGLVFGSFPALALARVRKGEASAVSAAGVEHGSRALAAAQLAFATALLVVAALLARSFVKLATLEVGFEPRGAMAFEVVLPAEYSVVQKTAVAEALAERLAADPRIAAVGYTNLPPLTAAAFGGGLTPDGQGSQSRTVSHGYLEAIGARLVEGRWLAATDGTGTETVLVTRAYAERYYGGGSPIGSVVANADRAVEIVGVIDHIKLTMLAEAPSPAMFVDARQIAGRAAAQLREASRSEMENYFVGWESAVSFAIRSDADPRALEPDVRALVRAVDERAILEPLLTLDEALASMTRGERFYAVFAGVFAALAGLLAVVGIYGLLSYAVSQRTKEIGIRVALGASRASVSRLILRGGVALVAIGLPLGLLGAAALTRLLSRILYDVAPLDAATYGAVAAAFAAVALLAGYVPARRASKVDPMVSLRNE